MIIPALDLINNKIVRLYQGCYEKQRQYSNEVNSYINKYIKEGTQKIHLIDLDGAQNPHKRQINLITKIITQYNSIKFQIGGGIRNKTDIKYLLNMGASNIIIGSMAITQPKIIKSWLKYFNKDILILAMDVNLNNEKKYIIAINAWKKYSNLTLDEVITEYNSCGIKNILCTDISRDGTLSGSNIKLYKYLCKKWPNIKFQASGGINNIKNIKTLYDTNVSDVIIGRAILENKINIREAIKCWQKE